MNKQRLHFLPSYLMEDLNEISVVVVGAGGTGSYVLSGLAKINVALKNLDRKGLDVVVFDRDKVSESNIGRQLFSPHDVGLNKATILTERINRFYGTSWKAFPNKYPQKKFNPANIIISCVDNVKTRFEIISMFRNNNFYDQTEKPYYFLDFGNKRTQGQVVLGTFNEIVQPETSWITKGYLPTIIDHYPDLQDDDMPSCSTDTNLSEQDLFINHTISSFGLSLLWKLLRDFFISEQGVYINLETFNTLPIKI